MKTFKSFKSLVACGLSFVAAFSSTACVIEVNTTNGALECSGVIVSRSGSLKPYNELEVSSAVKVDFVIGDDYSYTFSADSALIDRYYINNNNNKLDVGSKEVISFRWKSMNEAKPVLTLTVPSLDAFQTLEAEFNGASEAIFPAFNMESLSLEANGASHVVINGAKIKGKLDLDCSGASTLKANAVEVGAIKNDCSGASTAYIDGQTAKLESDCSGASSLYASDLKVSEYVNLECSGASHTTIGDLSGVAADFDASGASSISYAGSPEIRSSDASGASRIRKQ